MKEESFDQGRHKFFRAMVLMGSGIALGCGGMVDSAEGAGASGHSAKEGDGAGTGGTSDGSGGTSAGSGGTTAALGGTSSGSGGAATVTGGSSSTGGAAGSSSACSPSQWRCDGFLACERPEGYTLPANCRCDETLPLSGDDCPSGRRVCLAVAFASDGTPLSEPVPLQCACAVAPSSCTESCRTAFPDGDGHDCMDAIQPQKLPAPLPVDDDILCGCSFVYLR